MNKYNYYLVLFLVLPDIGFAQDIHFSQFFNAPLTLNPASAGIIKGDFRVVNIYRQQWKSVAFPYNTYAVSCDGPLYKEKIQNGSLGFGVSFFNDRAGDAGFSTNQIDVTFSANSTLNGRNNLSVGLQGGLARRSVDAARLQSLNQFDGTLYHAEWPTGETVTPENFSYADFSAGLFWNFAPNQSDQVHIGAAVFHFNSPLQSYYHVLERMRPKLVVHGGGELGIGKSTSLIPELLFQNQGETYEISSGGLLRFEMEESAGKVIGKAFSLGGFYRFDDAVVATVAVEIAKWKIGLSYDVNTSGLSGVSGGKGGFEMSLVFMTPNTFVSGIPKPSFL